MLTLANEQFALRLTAPEGGELTVLLNIADDPFDFEIEGVREVLLSGGDPSGGETGELTGDAVAPTGDVLSVDGHGWVIVRTGG